MKSISQETDTLLYEKLAPVEIETVSEGRCTRSASEHFSDVDVLDNRQNLNGNEPYKGTDV